jgi:hypothetical protein
MKIYHTVANVVNILAQIGMCKIICRFVGKSLQQSADFSAKIFAARYEKQISELVFQPNIFIICRALFKYYDSVTELP